MYGGQEVVFLIVQHIVVHGHAGSDKLGDAALDEFLRQLRIFKLVAYSHSPTRPHEFRQISVESVMWETRHLRPCRCTVVASCKSDAKYFRCRDGVFAISLIEVAAAEQKYRIGMLCLKVEELLHHRSQFVVFLCHKRYKNLLWTAKLLKVGLKTKQKEEKNKKTASKYIIY